MAKGNESTTKFKADISELKKAFQEAQRQVRLANAEFKAATAGMDDWTKSADGLSAKITQLNKVLDGEKKKLANLEQQYRRTVEEQGENSRGAQELAIKINNQRAVIGKVEKELGKYNSALEEVSEESKDVDKASDKASKAIKDVGDSSKKAEKETSGFGKALGGALKKGLLGVAGAAVGAVAGFLASGEASQEFMEDMGKLEAGFTSSGHTAETAKKSYEGMVGILGETDQSVEAVNHLAKLTQSEEELAKWTDIAAGIYGTFGDSLPIEGLTEAANETAKVGQVTGPLADALNWAGLSEDEFNAKLAACADEQERATLITETLSETYRDAADAYKEVNGDLIAARQATSDMNAVMAEMGQIAMPITTALKVGFTSLVKSMLPDLQELGDGITGLMNGVDGAEEKVGGAVSNILTTLVTSITNILPKVAEIGVQIINSLISGLSDSKTLNSIFNAITQIITTLADGIVQVAPQLLELVVKIVYQVIDTLIQLAPDLLNSAIQLFQGLINALMKLDLVTLIEELIVTLIYTLIDAVPQLLDGAITLFTSLLDALMEIVPELLNMLPYVIQDITKFLSGAVPQIVEAAITMFMALVEALPIIIESLVEALPDIIAAVIDFFMTNIPVLWNAAIQLFMALVQAIPTICLELLKAVPQIVMAILQGLSQLPLMLVNFFTSIWEMIKDVFAPVVNWFKSKFEMAWNMVKQIWTQPKKFFADLWTKIKEIFSKVGDWFKENFGKAWDNVKSAFEPAKNFFANVWSDIKSAFSAVKSWFSDTFSGAWEGIKSAFSSVKSWFSDLWSGIKSVFSGVGDWFGDTFNKAVSAIKTPINYVIDALNYLIRGMNKISFDIPDWVPGVGGKNFGIDIGEIPKLAMGGIIDKPTTAIIGENGKEAVIPLENNTRWLDIVASKLATRLDNFNLNINGQATPNVVNNFYQTNNSPKSLSRLDIYRQSKNLLSMKGV